MPSDSAALVTLVDRVMAALAPRVEASRTAAKSAEDEVRRYVYQRRGRSHFAAEQALIELGPFAIGRIDPERFALLLGDADGLTPQAESVFDRAEAVLAQFADTPGLHEIDVPPGGDLRDAVKRALDEAGQIFGASRAVDLARSGTFDPERHNRLLSSLGFRHWNRAERQLAPPLVVSVSGEDCLPAGLGDFLDGAVALVIVATGPTSPAPLARLITPGTFVMQTADPSELSRLAASPHPGVALVFDQERPEQARFVHDPDAGDSPAERLAVGHMPDQPKVGRGRRTPLWLQELEHLAALAATAPGPGAAGGVAPPAEDRVGEVVARETSADKLAAWLLAQTDLEGV